MENKKNVFYRGVLKNQFVSPKGKTLFLLSPAIIVGWHNLVEVVAVAINGDTIAHYFLNPSPGKGDQLNCDEVYGGEFTVKKSVENLDVFKGEVTVQTVKGELIRGEIFKIQPGEFVTLTNAKVTGAIYSMVTTTVIVPWDNIAHINTPPVKVEKINRRNPQSLREEQMPSHFQKADPMRNPAARKQRDRRKQRKPRK